ncbi:MAG TPA: hypothetical protein QF353_02245 [Gammaproteobacteria bacterium]|nr:hypothetical protein [Gammaproteobacteria bacterium]
MLEAPIKPTQAAPYSCLDYTTDTILNTLFPALNLSSDRTDSSKSLKKITLIIHFLNSLYLLGFILFLGFNPIPMSAIYLLSFIEFAPRVVDQIIINIQDFSEALIRLVGMNVIRSLVIAFLFIPGSIPFSALITYNFITTVILPATPIFNMVILSNLAIYSAKTLYTEQTNVLNVFRPPLLWPPSRALLLDRTEIVFPLLDLIQTSLPEVTLPRGQKTPPQTEEPFNIPHEKDSPTKT